MEKRIVERIIKKDVYVAFDGKEFDSELCCIDYETGLKQEKLEKETEEKLRIKTHADFPSMINIHNDHEYLLFLIRTEEDLDLFIKTYNYWFLRLENYPEVNKDNFSYPEVLCILDFPKGAEQYRLYKVSNLCNQFSAFINDIMKETKKNINAEVVDEAREILGGCDWCKEGDVNVADFSSPSNTLSLQVQINEGQIQVGLNHAIAAGLDIKFCPMCGRKIIRKIQVNLSENKCSMFEIIDRLPELENLENLEIKDYSYPDKRCIEINGNLYLDPVQPNDEVYKYELYELKMFDISNYEAGEDIDDYIKYEYVAIKKKEQEIEEE